MIRTDIDRSAPVLVRLERIIAAPLGTVWQLHKDVPRWPDWQEDIASATLDGQFAAGNAFTWTTTGLADPIVSTIYAIEPRRSTLWGGPSAGIDGVHRWAFDAVATGTRVVTEESWSGAPVEGDPAKATEMLRTSLDRWLDFLAVAARRPVEAAMTS